MTILKPDKITNFGGVTINEYLLTKNVNFVIRIR